MQQDWYALVPAGQETLLQPGQAFPDLLLIGWK